MSIGPLLSAVEVPPQAVTPTPTASAPRAARPTRAAARGDPCRPPARAKRRLRGLEKRVRIKFLPYPIGLVYKERGRVADSEGGGSKIPPPEAAVPRRRGSPAPPRRGRPERLPRRGPPSHRGRASSPSRCAAEGCSAAHRAATVGRRARSHRRPDRRRR